MEISQSRDIIRLEDIVKKYYIGTENELEVLHGVSLSVRQGEFAGIVGESGSGKSTLMNVIGLLDRPTSGRYYIQDVDVSGMRDDDLSAIRNHQIGFVFQTYNLIARTTALDNVAMPMLYAGVPLRERRERAQELLEMVGMADRMSHDPSELSGGQKQRVAIARAMANRPAIILADEPTGALDSQTSRTVMDIFHRLHEEQGSTILMITHSQILSEECSRILMLEDGRITGERRGQHAR
ncbi:ABC transporter ATP-binding protein [Lachnoclostridium sp. Marseille-P6806]|uniref:ABC transporter ATP-binding protein n=1 Tax=Lachnoclostridium sp. Marseille-P6806 TaxID=2364793 RepID=UPI001031E46A|nr:ABC transporter ATP-binding protein [Lachnoclostridium sp. Marseille-P6806]